MDLGSIDIKGIFEAIKKFFNALYVLIAAVLDAKKDKVAGIISSAD